jgi:ribose transport system permease protein
VLARLRGALRGTVAPQVAATVLLYVVGTATIDGYGARSSVISMLVLAAFLGIAAAGQTLAVLLGGIDLSIPSLIGLGNVMCAQLTGNGWPFLATLLFIGAIALAIGSVNGFVAKAFSIHPLIVTLGIGAVVAGGLLVWTGGKLTGGAPPALGRFVALNTKTFGIGVPPIVFLWLAIALVLIAALNRTASGRRLYATAANEPAAALSLVRTRRVWIAVYAASALCAAMAGVLLTGFSGTGYLDVGQPYLFTTIASVVIGGTSLLGARGGYGRTVLGALILTQITTILVGHGLSPALQQAVLGAMILAVVAAYGREPHVRYRV